ncbi:hypothetical protein, partial [Aestuariibacter sp. GS-14]|uniref:hypothetical protein n=1 Tax=Aestuariibacter sp. GS-14 TaxID=2590670 RepID=UPI0015E86DDB
DDGDAGSGDGSDDGDSGIDTNDPNVISLSGKHTEIIGNKLVVKDIGYGVSEFTGIDQSLLMVGGDDLDDIDDLLSLSGAPENAFVLIAVFETQANQRASSLIFTHNGDEYEYECTINCDFNVDLTNRKISYNDAVFVWVEGTETLTLTGYVPWLESDEVISSEDQDELGNAQSETLCDLNMSTNTTVLADSGLAYTVDEDQCVGVKEDDLVRTNKPYTFIDANSGETLTTGEIKLTIRNSESAIALYDEEGNFYNETTILGTFDITNNSDASLCRLGSIKWQLNTPDGLVYEQAMTLSYTYLDTEYSYPAQSNYSSISYDAGCIASGESRSVNIEFSGFTQKENPLTADNFVSATIQASLDLKTGNIVPAASLQPDYMEWTYVNSRPAMRLALTNNSSSDLVFDEDAHNVLFYDAAGYLVATGYVTIHDQLGLADKIELSDQDYVFSQGAQFLLLDDSSTLVHASFSPARATKVVLYPRF